MKPTTIRLGVLLGATMCLAVASQAVAQNAPASTYTSLMQPTAGVIRRMVWDSSCCRR